MIEEISQRIKKGIRACYTHKNLKTCKLICKKTKNKLYMTLIKRMLDLHIVSTRRKELICI
jgi:hypothetical protein